MPARSRPIKVLEMGGYSAGYAGRHFVRAGADVVRLENDEVAPGWASHEAMDTFLHAGKRRVRFTSADVHQALIQAADVVVCEFDQAAGFAALAPSLSGTLHAVVTPFGLTGPKRNWQATPSTLLAMGGYTNLMGDADQAPLSLPGHYLEFQAGTLAFAAANAALLANKSDLIDIGMFETLMALSQFTTVRWHCSGQIRSRHGSDFWFVSPSDLFACKDGWVYINIVPTFWDAFLVLIDVPELMVDERFQTGDGRMQHRDDLHQAIAHSFLTLTKAEIEERAASCRVPLGVVRTLDDVLAEPHLDLRDCWETLTTSGGREVRSPRLSYRFDGTANTSYAVGEVEDA